MLKLYKCEARYDLMSEEEMDATPDYDIYRGYVVVATNAQNALFAHSLRSQVLGGPAGPIDTLAKETIDDLLATGLPISDEEWSTHTSKPDYVREYGRVIWRAVEIGQAHKHQPENQIVMVNFRAG